MRCASCLNDLGEEMIGELTKADTDIGGDVGGERERERENTCSFTGTFPKIIPGMMIPGLLRCFEEADPLGPKQ